MSKSAITKMTGIVLVVIILAAIVIGVGGYYYYYVPSLKPPVPNPDTLIVNEFGDVDNLDPARDYESRGWEILQNVYETLISTTEKGSTDPVPKLAERYEMSPDGTVYTFYLRKDVKFQDGTPFNAQAVKYSWDRAILINDPDGPAWIIAQAIKGGPAYMGSPVWQSENATEVDKYVKEYLAVEGVKVIDDYTLQVTLEFPYAPFLTCVAAVAPAGILSPTFVEAHGGVKPGWRNEYIDTHGAPGTGPFKIAEWTPKQRIVLERFDEYRLGAAKLKRVIINEVDEVSTRELNLFAGEVDHIEVPFTNAFDIIEKDPWLKEKKVVPLKPGIKVEAGFPVLTIHQITLNTLMEPCNNKEFRYALSYVFPYDTFIETALNGFGVQTRGIIPKGMFGYDETLFQFKYDPDKAKEYFLKAGWKGTFTFWYNAGNEVRKRAGLLLKDSIEKLDVGITVKVQELDWPTYLAKIRAKELEVYMIGWIPDYPDPDNYIVTYAHSTMGVYAKRIGYANKTIDKMVEDAAKEMDAKKRFELYSAIQRELLEEAVYIYCYQPVNFHIVRDWVQGYYFNPLLAGPSYSEYYYKWFKGY